jgi:hypothetical protein
MDIEEVHSNVNGTLPDKSLKVPVQHYSDEIEEEFVNETSEYGNLK